MAESQLKILSAEFKLGVSGCVEICLHKNQGDIEISLRKGQKKITFTTIEWMRILSCSTQIHLAKLLLEGNLEFEKSFESSQ